MSAEIRIIVADDHPVFRHGLRQVIIAEPDMNVAAEAGDGVAALEFIRESVPDVAVLDIRMPRLDGFDVAQHVADEQLRTKLMFLTMHAEPVMFERAMAMGVTGYVLKDAALSEVVQAIRTVASGRMYLSPAFSEYLVRRTFLRRRAMPAPAFPLCVLGERERQILRLIAESQTSKEIAETLGLNYRTIENLRGRMSQKLGLQGSHALVKFAFEHKTEL